MEKEITVDKIIAANYEVFKALDDPIRGKIVQLLNKKQLNVEQITRRLKKFGYKKAVTTIRHHVEILKDSGLIEIVKIEESRGAVTKYYGSSIKLLDFTLPLDFNKNYSNLILKTSLKLSKVIGPILKNFSKTRKIQQINYNNYIVMEIMNRSITNLLEKK
ncbi:MAG: winged helix-turn-helix domain-containing protein [Alphaproteobacteria bacterium]|jgi:DNA-binding transcriptional ArsR family regulator|nr:winged helix-turn-helix domain-containing protein [Alphaproteobacteria bacterium]